MDRDESVDLRALVHETAEVYLGHTETIDELVTGITDLAHEHPGRARQLVESIAAAADEATHGQHTEEFDSVEQLALKTLGLHAEAVVNATRGAEPEGKQEE